MRIEPIYNIDSRLERSSNECDDFNDEISFHLKCDNLLSDSCTG